MNTNKVQTARTAAQARSAAKDGKAQKARRRARYVGLPCAWCGFACYWGTDRTGRAFHDGTTGHLKAHTDGGTYAWDNTAPSCTTCQTACGTTDQTGKVAPVTDIPTLSDALTFLSTYVAPARSTVKGTAAQRDAARKARHGF